MSEKHSFIDLYEALQISPTADLETIHRVYRLLALRYHPDNGETGNARQFELVLRAYRTLSDAEKRAAYDVRYHHHQRLRWRIFDQNDSLNAREIEKRQRRGILSLLYAKRLQQVQKPGLNLREMESLLGCAHEHLEFSLWYLREKGLIESGDSALYWITAAGVDACNKEVGAPTIREDHLLPSARPAGNGGAGHQTGHTSPDLVRWTARPPKKTAPVALAQRRQGSEPRDSGFESRIPLGPKVVLK